MNPMELTLPVIHNKQEKFPSLFEISLYPTKKVPIVFTGTKVLHKNYYHEDEFGCLVHSEEFPAGEFLCGFTLYITENDELVIEKTEWDFSSMGQSGNPSEYVKIRVLRTYQDVWTLFKSCEQDESYRDFLMDASKELSGKESYFWLPLL